MIKQEDIKSIIVVGVSSSTLEKIEFVEEKYREMIDRGIENNSLPLEFASETNPLMLYSSATALSVLKVVFKLQSMFDTIKCYPEFDDDTEVEIKIFGINETASIVLH